MISPKQKKILAFPYSRFGHIICDGAVRSGKTSIMSVTFIRWAMENFNGCRFGICGKTVGSAEENIIALLIAMSYIKQNYRVTWRRSNKLLIVKLGYVTNIFEVLSTYFGLISKAKKEPRYRFLTKMVRLCFASQQIGLN